MTQTLAQGIEHSLQVALDAGAIEFQGRWTSWGQLAGVMNRIGKLLGEAAVQDLAPVAVLLRNRPGMLAAALQLIRSERCVITINPFQGPDKVATDIRSLRPAVVIADPQDWALPELRNAAAQIGCLAIGVTLYGEASEVAAVPGLDRLGAGPFHASLPNVAVLMLSSGTTGPAKRIELPAAQLEQSLVRSAAYERKRTNSTLSEKGPRSPLVLSAPLVHIGGLYFALDAVFAGRPLVLLEKFNVPEYCRVLRAYRPKVVSLPPVAMRMMLDAEVDADVFSSVMIVRAGSAPLPPELKQRFEERFKVPVLDVYGATEFAGAVAGWSLEDYKSYDKLKVGSVGRAQPGIELQIVDPVHGTPLPAGQTGVLEIRSTASKSQRWVRTTDLAELDADGFLYIRGRADDAIIRGGFKVLPREIEVLLREHPDVHECCVVGLPDERLGAVPVAAVETRGGASLTEKELLAWLRARLVAYQVPTQLLIVPALPRTPSMKISQYEVRGLFAGTAA